MTTKAKKNYNNFKFKPKDTLLFGRESEGVPKIVHDKSYQRLRIPLKKNMRSLNIGMAVAITLSEALKQNNFDTRLLLAHQMFWAAPSVSSFTDFLTY